MGKSSCGVGVKGHEETTGESEKMSIRPTNK